MKTQRFFIRLIVSLSLMGWGQFVFAEDYYWRITPFNSQSYYVEQYDSPSAACDRYKNVGSTQNEYWYRVRSLTKANESLWYCEVSQQWGGLGNAAVQNQTVRRYGDSCPEGSEFNPETGKCEAPEPSKCESTIGNTITHQHKLGIIGGARTPPPGSICENECQYAFTGTPPKDVYRFADPDSAQRDNAYGAYTYKGNGVECTGGDTSNPSNFDQPPTKLPVPLDPTLTKDIQCTDWSTNADGTGSRTCNNVSEYKDPGKLDCSTGTGQLVCHLSLIHI